jgi:hypothetical protein
MAMRKSKEQDFNILEQVIMMLSAIKYDKVSA